MQNDNIVWARSVLAVYRQAATEAARPDLDAVLRQRLIDDLARDGELFAAHERMETLWRDGFGGTEENVRAALRPLAETALLCDPDSPMRALVEFAAEEIAFLFEDAGVDGGAADDAP